MAIERGIEWAISLLEGGRPEEARAYCESLVGEQPQHFDALCMLCYFAMQAGDLIAALRYIDRALDIDDSNATAHFNRGAVLQGLKDYTAALASYQRAIAIQPLLAEAHSNKSALDLDLGMPEDALRSAMRAIEIRNEFPDALFNRANAYQALRRVDEAIVDYERAIALKPRYAEAYCNLGLALASSRRWSEASSSFSKALVIRPDYPKALINLGNVCGELRQWKTAVQHYDRALFFDASNGDALASRGVALRQLGDHASALASFELAYRMAPAIPGLLGLLLHQKLTICEWSDMDSLRRQLAVQARIGANAAAPFDVLSCIDSAELQRKVAEIYTEDEYPEIAGNMPGDVRSTDPLTVAYFSADFHRHATGYLIAELFELHDRSRFRIVGISFGPDSQDPMRRRLAAACDEFIDVRNRSDAEIVALSRQLRIDIAVDLKGYTTDSRPGVFARRAAPVQVSYLGYPGTLGATYMDYLIADPVVVPPEDFAHYSEKICQLPDSYQPNDRQRMISARQYSRYELGLPWEAFVYCCFNNSWKIGPEVFECWMTILKSVPHSVLWLLECNEYAKSNLQAEARRRGVDASRLIFAGFLPLDEHLARLRCADLCLDTWPYCAHTTASDALWAGMPILAWRGNSFAARVSASLLRSVGLPHLVAAGPCDYIEQAVSLASDLESLAGLRRHLENKRLECELFDTERYARHLEAGYLMMAERARARLPPDHLIIPPTTSKR